MDLPYQYPVKASWSGVPAQRAGLLWDRLHKEDHYSPEKAMQPVCIDWPGDLEGRILLAWTLLGEVVGKSSGWADQVWADLPAHLNKDGYFGNITLPDQADEQQLSGNSWFLRALCERYRITKSPQIRQYALAVLEHLFMPLKGRYAATYPTERNTGNGGKAMGSHDGVLNDWHLSTDVGCGFIPFDAIVQAADLFGINLHDLIREMMHVFKRIDVLKNRLQTHATLSFMRGLIRWYNVSGDADALRQAESFYRIYRLNGMTEHYANFNWFNRSDSWTEPCAIVDSFQCALGLSRITGDESYLDDAHRIWFTGIGRAQRDNGGMGLENCPCHEDRKDTRSGESSGSWLENNTCQVSSHEIQMYHYEAYWCCTMRAAEGFHEAAMHTIRRIGDSIEIDIPFPGTYTFADGLQIRVNTDYPISAAWSVEVLHGGQIPVETVRAWRVGVGWGDSSLVYSEEKRPLLNGNGYTLWMGPRMLGVLPDGRHELLDRAWQMTPEELKDLKMQVIFTDGK